jgi:polyene macrolide polyketide synthase
VSSFGISGTNAHVVLEEAPSQPEEDNPAKARAAELLVLSAKVPGALDEAAAQLLLHVQSHPEASLHDVAYSLATTRTHHEHRLALTVTTRQELIERLDVIARGKLAAGVVRDEVSNGKVSFLFTGQGAQMLGMGRELHAEWPVFREALEAAWAAFDPHLPTKLRDVMWAEPGSAEAVLIDQTEYTQPALFSLEVALAALWQSWGVHPDYLAGHSIGELAAAHVAGVFSLEDAARLVAARGRLMQALPAGGAMMAIAASESAVVEALAGHGKVVSVAAVNGPSSVVISGEATAVLSIAESFTNKGIRTKRLEVSHAFHSPRMEPMLAAFREIAESVKYRAPSVPIVSNVTGVLSRHDLTEPEYWVKHVREAVRFAEGIVDLHAKGVRTFIEIGPKATLLGLVPSCLSETEQERIRLVKSLSTDKPDCISILEGLARHFARGGLVKWPEVFAGGGNRVELPTYAWQRTRYWIDSSGVGARAGDATDHPLLGIRVSVAGSDAIYESVLSRADEPWLYDHRLDGKAVLPAAALAEIMRAAGEHYLATAAVELSGVIFESALWLPEHGGRRVQTILKQDGDGVQVAVYSQPANRAAEEGWKLHASGRLHRPSEMADELFDWPAETEHRGESLDVDEAHARIGATGMEYGPAFRGARRMSRDGDVVLAEVELPAGLEKGSRYGIHPALLDASFRTVIGFMQEGTLALPFALDRLRVRRSGLSAARVHARSLASSGGAGFMVDVTLCDADGRIIAEVTGLQGRGVEADSLVREQLKDDVSSHLYRLDWSLAMPPSSATSSSGRWVVVARAGDAMAAALAERLTASGRACSRVEPGRVDEALPADHVVCMWSRAAETSRSDEALRVSSEGLAVVHRVSKESKPPRLWWLTVGAVAAMPSDRVDPVVSSLWGLGRTLMEEQPELDCTLIDVEPGEAGVEQALRELGNVDDEHEVAWRSGERHAARLVRAPAPSEPPARSLRTDGTVLVTGGLGELGLLVARSLARQGVKRLVLLGRRGLDTPEARDAVSALVSLGVDVTVAAADVADAEALARVISAIGDDAPLRGIVHAAGVLEDGVLSEQTPERMARVMAAKIAGACNLDVLTRRADLDVFVLFSSVAGTIGNAGQGPYAAANAFLDGLAARRRVEGLPAQSLAWGMWLNEASVGVGLASGLNEAQRARLRSGGLGAFGPQEGIALFEAALGRADAQLVPLRVDVKALSKKIGNKVPPRWRALIQSKSRPAVEESKGWIAELGGASGERRLELVLDLVRSEVARVLSLPSGDAVPADRPLKELGLDSLMSIEVRNALGKRAGVTLPATLVFDYPTAVSMTQYLVDKVLPADRPSNGATLGVLADIERIEAALATETLTDDIRAAVLAKMSSLIAKLTTNEATASLSERIVTATDDELFQLLDRQLEDGP